MEESRPMEMIRIPAEEQVFEREAVLGRDATSVFPTESVKAEVESRANAFKALFGDDRRFVTESELRDIQDAQNQRSAEEVAASKPLAEVLRDAKEAKESAFQETWKQMKTGKNRPLDEEELEFFDAVAEAEALKRRREQEEEAAELDSFRRLRQEQEEGLRSDPPGVLIGPAAPPPETAGRAAPQQTGPRLPQKRGLGAVLKPMLRRVVRKEDDAADPPAASDPEGDTGLAGLLGGYASSGDEGAGDLA
ncbi:hypothetical protein ACKKBF_B38210 [Auxenochlorella protothecoides x Auxenochlorella symbiontica]